LYPIKTKTKTGYVTLPERRPRNKRAAMGHGTYQEDESVIAAEAVFLGQITKTKRRYWLGPQAVQADSEEDEPDRERKSLKSRCREQEGVPA